MFEEQINLTCAQEAVYFDQLLHDKEPLYNVGGYVVLRGYTAQAIAAAHRTLLERERVFRTRLVQTEQLPMQRFTAAAEPSVEIADLTGAPDVEAAAQVRIAALFAQHIDFDGPLFRVSLLKTGAAEFRYAGVAHHVIIDGWGFFNWARVLLEALEQRPAPATLSASVDDLLAAEREYANSARYALDRSYWTEKLQHATTAPLIAHYVSPGKAGARSKRYAVQLTAQQQERIVAVARHLSVGTPAAYLAALAIHFLRYLDAPALSIGIPFHCRSNAARKGMIGQMVKVLPINLARHASTTPADLLTSIERELKAVYRHHRLPIADVHACARQAGHAGRLFDICFNYIDTSAHVGRVSGAPLFYVNNGYEDTPLTMTVFESDGARRLCFDYRTDFFREAEVARIAARIHKLIDGMETDLRAALDEVDVLTDAERARLAAPAPAVSRADGDLPIHEVIARNFASHADRTAVVHGGMRYSYRDLERRVADLESALLVRGVGRGARVGLHLHRHFDLLATMIALLRLGACYVPLDPKYPGARIRQIIDDSALDLLLVENSRSGAQLGRETVELGLLHPQPAAAGGALRASVTGDDLFYIVYTSGSTGAPKGVRIRHRNVAALVAWAREAYSDEELDIVLASTSINFDLSVFEIFVPLCCGTTVELVEDILSVPATQLQATLINTVPSAIVGLLQGGALAPSVRTINLAGEQLRADIVAHIFSRWRVRRVFNLYGPSEDTTYSTFHCFHAPCEGQPPIGKPLPGKRVRLLSRDGKLVPIGAVGEIFLGGSGLSDGYHNNDELTQRAFVADAYAPHAGERLYRTGDLARYIDDDLCLVYVGRVDDQVKVRGFRIELQEVEAVLRRVLRFSAVAVLAFGEYEDRYLAAFFETSSLREILAGADAGAGARPALEPERELRQLLGHWLPAYMVPDAYVALPRFPLTSSGKIDRRAFPRPLKARSRSATIRTSGASGAKHAARIAAMVADLLGVASVDPDATFFSLGGNSLQAVKLRNRIRREFGADVELSAILANPTVHALASLLETGDAASGDALEPVRVSRSDSHPASAAQAALWVFETLSGAGARYNLPASIEIRGEFSVDIFTRAVERIVACHEVLRTRYEMRDGVLYQIPMRTGCNTVSYFDLSEEASPVVRVQVESLRTRSAAYRFDLTKGEVLRVDVIKLATDRFVVFICLHHIAFDGWSIALFQQELSELYSAMRIGSRVQRTAPALQYVDYAAWKRQRGAASPSGAAVAFWSSYLSGAPEVHGLPVLKRQAINRSLPATTVEATIRPADADAVLDFCRRNDITPFYFFQAALAFLVCRIAETEEVVVGAPAAGREHPAFEAMLGLFVNPVAFRYRRAPSQEFHAFLADNRTAVEAALAHQATPFACVVERRAVARDSQLHPVFQLWFVYDDFGAASLDLPGVDVEVKESIALIDPKFDLNLYVAPAQRQFCLRWIFSETLFAPSYVQLLSAAYVDLVREVCGRGPAAADSPLALLDGQVTAGPRRTAVATTAGDLWGALRASLERNASRVAIHGDTCAWTYERLAAAAQDCAERLSCIDAERVLLLMGHGESAIAAIVGAVQAGKTYVPVDSNVPVARLERMLSDSGALAILANGEFADLAGRLAASNERVAVIDLSAGNERAPRHRDPGRAPGHAYILYTSGSTGTPKGISQSAANVHFYANRYIEAVGLGASDTLLMTSRFYVDASVLDLFGALLCGATLQLCDLRTEMRLLENLGGLPISVFHFTPTTFKSLFAEAGAAALRGKVILGGERIDADTYELYQRVFAPQSELIGLYGSTEASISFINRRVTRATIGSLGHVVPGLAARLVAPDGRATRIGEEGELLIGGDSIEPNYLDEGINSARYGKSGAGGHFYRTGDLCRLLPSGEFEFLGRNDFQIKILGQRVELDEIDSLLRRSGLCNQAITLLHRPPTGAPRLHCFVTVHGAAQLDPADCARRKATLRDVLRSALPYYMIPRDISIVAEIPRTASGKADRHKLFALIDELSDADPARVLPRNDLERELHDVWCELLAVDSVGVADEFFSAGGDSLTLVSLISRIGSRFDVALFPKYFYGALTIERLAEVLECARHYRGMVTDSPAGAQMESVEI